MQRESDIGLKFVKRREGEFFKSNLKEIIQWKKPQINKSIEPVSDHSKQPIHKTSNLFIDLFIKYTSYLICIFFS